jgi:hypothetical protein
METNRQQQQGCMRGKLQANFGQWQPASASKGHKALARILETNSDQANTLLPSIHQIIPTFFEKCKVDTQKLQPVYTVDQVATCVTMCST